MHVSLMFSVVLVLLTYFAIFYIECFAFNYNSHSQIIKQYICHFLVNFLYAQTFSKWDDSTNQD